MDWLDQYLNGLGEYKTTVSPADTHIWGVKPKLNNVQERMIFDAVAQSELEFRQIVQEARTALEEHGMSNTDVEDGIGADPGSPARSTTTSVTPTPSITPTITVTPSITPTMTVTPTITVTTTITITPSITPTITPSPTRAASTAFLSLTTLAVSAIAIDNGYTRFFSTSRSAQKSWLATNSDCDSVQQGIWHDGSVWNMRFYNSNYQEYVGCVVNYDLLYTNNSPSDVIPLTGWPADVQVGKDRLVQQVYTGGVAYNPSSGPSNYTLTLSGANVESAYDYIFNTPQQLSPRIDYFNVGQTVKMSLCALWLNGQYNFTDVYGTPRRYPVVVSSNTNVATVNNSAQTITFVNAGTARFTLTAYPDSDYAELSQYAYFNLKSFALSAPNTFVYAFTGGTLTTEASQTINLSGIRMYVNDWMYGKQRPFVRSEYVPRLSSTNNINYGINSMWFSFHKPVGKSGLPLNYAYALMNKSPYQNWWSGFNIYTAAAILWDYLPTETNTTDISAVSAGFQYGYNNTIPVRALV